jgi:hypothetical protein
MNSCEEQSCTQDQNHHKTLEVTLEDQAMETENQSESQQANETHDHHDHAHEHHDQQAKNAKPPSKEQQEFIDNFVKQLLQQPDVESKLNFAISTMENTLSTANGSPSFRNFWEVRKTCIELFKDESLSPTARVKFWNKYIELSQEARRVKELLDEQSAFAAEQIDIAITALENDVKNLSDLLGQGAPFEFGVSSVTLSNRFDFYSGLQKELNFLNAYASRINALRKELIKTDMRIRLKNKFFQRLSAAGDLVFPRRKELIRDVSQNFMDDVEGFIKSHLNDGSSPQSLFDVREEIKSLQGIAKVLSLNTSAFTHTRMRLSESWDKIKHIEKERKKERNQQKTEFKQHAEEVLTKLNTLRQEFTENKLTTSESLESLEEITRYMRTISLGRDEIKALREEVSEIKKLIQEKLRAEEQAKQAIEQERERVKRAKISELRTKVETLFKDVPGLTVEALTTQRDQITSEINSSALSKHEKSEIEKLLKPLKDIILEKMTSSLSDDDKQAIQQLKALLKEHIERRNEVSQQLEQYRKANGASGLDFQKAFEVQEQIKEERNLLDKIEETISDIKQKIRKLESQS